MHPTHKIKHLLSLLLLTCATLTVTAQERRDVPAYQVHGHASSQQLDEIDDFLNHYKTAWSQQDTASLMQLHLQNSEWINAYARIFQDKDHLAQFLDERLFPNFKAQVSIQEMGNLKRISTRLLGDDVAVLHMYTDADRGASRNAGEAHRRTHIHLVLQHSKQGWQVAHTAIMDAR